MGATSTQEHKCSSVFTFLYNSPPHQTATCVRSSTSRPDSAATRSVPSSGKSSQTSTALTQLAHTTETLTSSWRGSTSTTMRPQEANTCPVPSLLTWSQEPWTPSALDLSARSSDPTTSSSDSLVLETTGPRATTQRALSSSTPSLTSSARRLSPATACRDSS